jgi:type I restriction enzyme S subunit
MIAWVDTPIKFLVSLNDEVLTETFLAAAEIHYVEISDVSEATGITWRDPIKFCDAPSRARRRIRDGDVLVSTVRTYLRAVAGVGNAPVEAVASTGFAVLRPKTIHTGFLKYAMLNSVVLDEVVARSVGVSYPAINASDLVSMKISTPKYIEQKKIATFLDRETAEIDAFIEDQKELIELLAERRAATISHAVMTGLDPNVEMKDSGLEPLPAVPAHWQLLRNKDLLRERVGLSETGDEELLTVSHITGVTRRSEKKVTMIEAESHDGYRLVEPGDLVINTMWAWMGALGVAHEAGMVSPAYGVYSSQRSDYHSAFFDYLYRSRPYVTAMTRFSRGLWSSRLRLYPDVFLALPTVLPPLGEQILIADALQRETAELDAAIADAREAIVLSRERRAALISAAVTGKIDVREHGAVA